MNSRINPFSSYLRTPIVAGQLLTAEWQRAFAQLTTPYNPLVVTDFGAFGDGLHDDTQAIQHAITQAIANGGDTVLIPSGTYLYSQLTIPAGTVPVQILGQGDSTILKRNADAPAGEGSIDIEGSNVRIVNLLIDGGVTQSVGLLYNHDFQTGHGNDPMAPSLTLNTSIWLHGPASNLVLSGVTFQHSGGYAVLIDAGSGQITDVQILNCVFQNNRPHLFGLVAGQAKYGSWTGGVYVNGDGTAENGNVLKRFLVAQSKFLRSTGNCLWSHLYGLTELHEDFQFIGNSFLDCGLDGIEIGGVTGGIVAVNSFRRIGYVCTDDTSQSTPLWLNGLNATAIDSSGLVKAVLYAANTLLSVNGGYIDMDGHGDSIISVNTCRIPSSDEPEYTEDQIAITGPTNSGSASYGVNLDNTSNTEEGSANLEIAGNIFINLPSGSIRLFGARGCHVTANNILAPADSIYPPIGMGPIGLGPNQRCTGNKVALNKIDYSPVAPAPAIFEDNSITPFLGTDVNYVYGNGPITGNGLATEFQKDGSSGSAVYAPAPWELQSPPVYANNAAAIAGGLKAGDHYRSGADPDPVYVVH